MSRARAAKALDVSVPFLSCLRRASRWHGERRCPLPPRLWDSNPAADAENGTIAVAFAATGAYILEGFLAAMLYDTVGAG
jgi:hypothetical protein